MRQLASESVIYGFAGVLNRFVSIFFVPIYTRVFNPEDYGLISLMTSGLTLASVFVVLALDNSAHRWFWDTEFEEDRKKTIASWAWCQIVVSTALAVLVVALSDWLSRMVLHRDDAGMYVRMVALTLPLGVLGVVVTNWFRMQRRPWATLVFSLGSSVFHIGTTILLVVVLGRSLAGVFEAQVATAFLSTFIAAGLLRQWIHPRKFSWRRLKSMLAFGLPFIPAAVAFWVINSSNRYFLQAYLTPADVGVFEVGALIASGIALITSSFQQAWGPFALSIHRIPDAKQVYANILLVYLWITCFVGAALAVFASEILALLTTDAYVPARSIVAPLSFSYVMIGLGYIAVIGATIAKSTGPYGIAVSIAALVAITLNVWLTPKYGKEGSAFATLIAHSIVPMYVFRASQRLYPIPYRFAPAVLLLVVTIVVIAGGNWLETHGGAVSIVGRVALLCAFLPLALILRNAKHGSASGAAS